MSTEIVRDFFAHFGIAILIAIIDFAIILPLAFSDKSDNENVYLAGFIVNALLLSIVLSILILGE